MKLNAIMKKILLGLVAATSAATALASPIPNFSLTGAGDFELKFTGYTAPSAQNGAGNFGSGLESTFGAGYVADIHDRYNASNIFWQQGNTSGTMSYILWGMADASADSDGVGGFNLKNVGCTVGPLCDGKIHLTFYMDNTTANGGSNPGFTAGSGYGSSVLDRVGNTLGGFTDGTMIMDWVMVPGAVIGDPTTTLFQHVNAITLPTTGNGSFYAECNSGSACSYFSKPGPDFFGVFTLKDATATPPAKNGWLGAIADPVVGTINIPEPTTILLFAAGLFGLARTSRRNKI